MTDPLPPDALALRLAALEAYLRDHGPLLLAFSGGVDSTFLAAVAHQALGTGLLAVTVDIPSMPTRLLAQARDLAALLHLRHEVTPLDQFAVPGFCDNGLERCYFCKAAILTSLRQVARRAGIETLADGGHADDAGDYRPGQRAVEEQGVLSPLRTLGWTKAEIRQASRRLGLPTADLPSAACLASRIPYGQPITARALEQVDAVEAWLETQGLHGTRARHHGEVVRLELGATDYARLLDPGFRTALAAVARQAGFRFAAVDVEPYRTGRLNPPGLAPGGV